jgi:Fur family transcriptional regulator, ferric uptake regulator
MTASPAVRSLAPADPDAAVAALRAHGLRISSARRLVVEALFRAGRPVRAEEIAGGLHGVVPPSDLASVYRNLETLEEVGLVRHVHFGHGPGLYTLTGAPEREYLLCEACGSVRPVPAAELDEVRARIREVFGHVARFSHFPIVGLCRGCAPD